MKTQSEMGRLLAGLFEDLQRGMILWQIVIIALALVVAWQVALHLRMRLATTTLVADPDSTLNIGIGGMNRELVPATVLVVLLVGRWVLEYHQPVHLFHIAVPLVLALVMIRVGLPVASHVEIDAGSCLIKLSGIERSCADGRSDRFWRQWYQSGTAGLARGIPNAASGNRPESGDVQELQRERHRDTFPQRDVWIVGGLNFGDIAPK